MNLKENRLEWKSSLKEISWDQRFWKGHQLNQKKKQTTWNQKEFKKKSIEINMFLQMEPIRVNMMSKVIFNASNHKEVKKDILWNQEVFQMESTRKKKFKR